MDDLRRRFASLDRVRTPDLRDEIELRAAALGATRRLIPVPAPVTRSRGISARSLVMLLAGLTLLTGLVAGAIAVGSRLVGLPALVPFPPASPVTSTGPSALPTPEITTGRIVYQRHTRIANGKEGGCVTPTFTGCTQWSTVFVANDDGSEPRELTPGVWDAEPVAVSPDGTTLIVHESAFQEREDRYHLRDLSGSGVEPLDTACVAPCIGDSGFAFSPDGDRLAFVRSFGTESVLAIMDRVTGEVVELDSTRVHSSGDPAADPLCADGRALGDDESPRWSPDGAHLLFTRSGMRTPDGSSCIDGSLVFIVDDDGGDLRELVPLALFARDAHWSSDGARIVFTSAVSGTTKDRSFHELNDIYTVRPDGTELTRLTTSSEGRIEPGVIGALRPSWTRDGRIVFVLIPRGDPASPQAQVWIMDADGSAATSLVPADASTLRDVGCVTCPYPPDELANGPDWGNAIWLGRP